MFPFYATNPQIFLGLGDPNRTLLRRMRSGKHLAKFSMGVQGPAKITPRAPKLLQI